MTAGVLCVRNIQLFVQSENSAGHMSGSGQSGQSFEAASQFPLLPRPPIVSVTALTVMHRSIKSSYAKSVSHATSMYANKKYLL